MKNKKRRKKRGRAKNPWGMRQTIALSMLAHGVVIAVVIALGWWQYSTEKPGSAIFVHEVVIGDSVGGATTTPSPPLKASSGIKSNPTRPPLNARGGENGEGSGANSTGGIVTGGDGLSSGAGNSGTGSGTGTAGNPILAEIRRRIEQSKRYPMQARAQHIEGKVGIQFLIQSNGQVRDVRVTRSSGTSVLDEAAIQAVHHSAPLPYYDRPIELSLAFRLK